MKTRYIELEEVVALKKRVEGNNVCLIDDCEGYEVLERLYQHGTQ